MPDSAVNRVYYCGKFFATHAKSRNVRTSGGRRVCMRVHECRIVFFIQNARAREREQAYGTVGYWTKVKFILHYFSVRKWADVLQKYAWTCVFTACDFCLHFNCDDVSLFGCTREIFLVRAEQQLACFFLWFRNLEFLTEFRPHNAKRMNMKSNMCTCVRKV